MATIKSYTDIEQSKVLAKILPLKSADMRYAPFGDTHPWFLSNDLLIEKDSTPCWSLAALLDVLPKGEAKDVDLCLGGYKGDKYIPEWFCSYEEEEHFIIEICHAPNAIDACYQMILKLYELNLL